MISSELLLTFAAAAFAVILIPGPTVLMVTGYALTAGLRTAMLSILGVCLGDATAMTLTFVGLGALLAASAELFLALKWFGAAYLIYLGIELYRAPGVCEDANERQAHGALAIVARAFTVNVFHPKGFAFYSAFLPQFIEASQPALPRMLTLGATFIAIAFCVLLFYATTAARFRTILVRPRIRRIVNRGGATCLIAAGLYTLSLKRD